MHRMTIIAAFLVASAAHAQSFRPNGAGGGSFSGGTLTAPLVLDATNTLCSEALSLSFSGDADTGFQRAAANTMSQCVGGILALSLTTTTVTTALDIAVNGGDMTTSAATFNLLNALTTLNIGSGATTIAMGGGSASTGCTLDASTGNFACTGTGTFASGSAITGSISTDQVARGSGTNTIAGDATFTANGTTVQITPSGHLSHALGITAGTTQNAASALFVTGTTPGSGAGIPGTGVYFGITGSGGYTYHRAVTIDLLPGFTGAAGNGLLVSNSANGAGDNPFFGDSGQFGTYSSSEISSGDRSGVRVGLVGSAAGSTATQVGVVARAGLSAGGGSDQASSKSVGLAALGRNTAASATQVGAYIGLDNDPGGSHLPTLTSAAAIIDNSDQAVPIATLRDNGVAKWTAINGGAVQQAEVTAPSGVASNTMLWADSTANRLKMNNNNTGAVNVEGVLSAVTAADITNATTTESTVLTLALPVGTFHCHAHGMGSDTVGADGLVVRWNTSGLTASAASQTTGVLASSATAVDVDHQTVSSGASLSLGTALTFASGWADFDSVLVVTVAGNLVIDMKQAVHTTGTATVDAGAYLRCEVM